MFERILERRGSEGTVDAENSTGNSVNLLRICTKTTVIS
jgi:hypothetical protein